MCHIAHLALFLVLLAVAAGGLPLVAQAADAEPLPGTEPLSWTGDIASRMVDGVDRFLSGETAGSTERRKAFWHRDLSSAEKYAASIEPNRRRLAHILGLRDPRIAPEALELVGTTAEDPVVGRGQGYRVLAVRWPALDGVHGEGLLLVPEGRKPRADIIAIPDAEHSPETLVGLVDGVAAPSQSARRLATSGCRVLVPTLVSRQVRPFGKAQLTGREYVHRPAFELGRHVIGYELQKVLWAVDWFEKDTAGGTPLGVIGWGEGGLLALYAAALEVRIDAALTSGYFDAREDLWQEPIDRSVFGLLEQFGDAELAAMIAPRPLVIEAAAGPTGQVPRGTGGAPGRLVSPPIERVRAERDRALSLLAGAGFPVKIELVGDGTGPFGSPEALAALLESLHAGPGSLPKNDASASTGQADPEETELGKTEPGTARLLPSFLDPEARQRRLIDELDRHTQRVLAESPAVRKAFFSKLDTSSPQRFADSVAWYRDYFHEEVIGRFDHQPLAPNPRSRRLVDDPTHTTYEVVLDVYPDVIAYGLLLLPKGIAPGERRPVVVCQHGLEGRPTDTLAGGDAAYSGFATRLAQRGFIVFAPQNPYLFGDRFRTLQRKANPLKKTLFAIIVPQHQQIVRWLASRSEVDPARIAFYGLSYGGKSAMRIPPLVPGYCLSICSADFNEWVVKNASTRLPFSYVFTGEYEIFEFDLGSTFNYAQMAALVAPRPFMVERGHFDAVGTDEYVAFEYAKVRYLYEAQLGIGDRTEIEWFSGPHQIHGVGTFAFLHKHLAWPEPKADSVP